MPTPLRIALADDQELFIESLSALLANSSDEVEVIWNARNGEETIEKVRERLPDVLLLDYEFKGKSLDGCEICRLLLQEFPKLGVLMLSVHDDTTIIREAFGKGARGYASKDIAKSELLRGIRAVSEGQYFLDQTALGNVIQSLIIPSPKPPRSMITPRELEVAKLYVKGKAVREIASTLYISEDTVESHIKNIRSKTACTNRFDVGEWMKKNGLWEE